RQRAHARRGRSALCRYPRTHSSDRGESTQEAASPVAFAPVESVSRGQVTPRTLFTVDQSKTRHLGTLGFALLLLLPSIDTVLKYTGIVGIAVYIAAGTASIFFFRDVVL